MTPYERKGLREWTIEHESERSGEREIYEVFNSINEKYEKKRIEKTNGYILLRSAIEQLRSAVPRGDTAFYFVVGILRGHFRET